MNPDFPQDERARLEAKLTALLLGELHADEVAALSQAMEKDPELAALYERLKFTVELVRESAANPGAQAAPLKLSTERREKLLASFKTVTPAVFQRPRRISERLMLRAAAVAIAAFFVSIAIPNFIKSRETARKNSIINNLRLVNGAKQQWAVENHKSGDAEPTMEDLKSYLGRGGSGIASVAGETYLPGKVSEDPTVETSVSQAKKLLGPEVAAQEKTREGKVVFGLSLEGAQIGGEIGGAVGGEMDVSQLKYRLARASAPQGQVASAPTAAPVAATKPPTIFLPPQQNIDAGALPGVAVASAAFNPQTGTESTGVQVATRSLSYSVDTLQRADRTPVQADLPRQGGFSRIGPKEADANGNFQTAATHDYVNRLSYLATNAVVASQPVSGATVTWGAIDGTTNREPYAFGAAGSAGVVAMADSWVPTNSGAVTLNGSTHNAGIIQGEGRRSEIVLPSATDGPLTAGTGAIAANEMQVEEVMPVGVSERGGGSGGGGAGGRLSGITSIPNARRAVGGKQVEIAAANSPKEMPALPPASPRLGVAGIESKRGAIPTAGAAERLKGEENVQTSQLVQEGKSLYQLGKTEESEAKMNEVLARDPSNQAALYYLSLARQKRVRQMADERNVTWMNRTVAAEKEPTDDSARGQLQVTLKPRLNSSSKDALEEAQKRDIEMAQKTAPYFAAKEQVEEAKKWRQLLTMKTGQEQVEVSLPKSKMVSITEPAVPPAMDKLTLGEKIKKAFTGKVESTARIQVDQEKIDIGGLGSGGNLASGYDPYFLLTEFQTIQSHDVLSRVAEAMDLKTKWGKKYNNGIPMSESEVEERIKKHLDFQNVPNTKVIEIKAFGDNPQEAADLANAVAKSYQNYRSAEYDELKAHSITNLKEELEAEDKKIAMLQSNVDKLRVDLKIPDALASASSFAPFFSAEQLRELSSMRITQEAEYNQQATLLEKLKKLDREDLRKALPIAYSDSELNTLNNELDLAEQNLIKLKSDYAPGTPKYQNAEEAVDDLKRKVDARVDGILAGLQSKMNSTKAYLDTFDQRIVEAQKGDAEQAKFYAELNAKINKSIVDSALPKPTVPPPTPQPEILTRENAFSTFSLNVSDVSFKLAAASLEKGQMPEPASIRSEEFINAFDYRDPDARGGAPIAFASERARYPFAHNRELLRFSLKTAAAGRSAGRPLNIVLLLDNSGSMERADRVRIIQEALRVLGGQLQASDTFSIVTFARTAQLRVDGIPGNQAAAAAAEIAKLTPEGGTNLGDALELAYETALHHYLANGDNRVVLLTDGAANLGDVNPDVLKRKVEAHRKQGVALDCFGIGWEGYNDDLLEVLTRNGDGRYGFINSPEDANTEFVAQIAGALHVAASDVKVQVEFNPKRVTSYRQIGYAKHQLTKEQFRDNTVDAAEIAAQEAGNALYTIETNPDGEGSIATVRVRYKAPGTAEYREQAWDVPYTGSAVALDQASPAMRLAATASAFSEWLATSPFAAEVSPEQLLNYLSGVPQVYGADARPAKLEWMIRQARSISGK